MLNFYRVLVFFFVILYLIYIFTVLLHLSGIVRITYREVTLGKALIPFYYWIKRYTNSNK